MPTGAIMKRISPTSLILTKMALALGMGLAVTTANAALTDIAPAPMANTSSAIVKPNLMFVLDDSGSMNWDFMPDALGGGVAPGAEPLCKGTGSSLVECTEGSDPVRASGTTNGIYYNPAITYTPAVKYDGTSYP